MRRSIHFACLTLALGAGCTDNFECRDRPTEPMCQAYLDGARFVDAGPTDTGADSPAIDAHVACGGSCSGSTRVCNTATDTCVGCLHDSDCSGSATHCEPTSHTCVTCLALSDCTTAAAARCDTTTHACAPCTTNGDCTHLPGGTGVCNMGACVQCAGSDEAACGSNVCDTTMHTCTTVPAGSVGICMTCTSDRACITGSACVTERFDTSLGGGTFVDVGSFCLPTGATCPLSGRPFVSSTMLANRAGVPTAVCDLRVATCPGYLAYGVRSCASDSTCGAPPLSDGLCRTRSGVGMQCTTRCLGPEDCNAGAGCSAGLTPHYCCFGPTCT